jgi:hypothetical protein
MLPFLVGSITSIRQLSIALDYSILKEAVAAPSWIYFERFISEFLDLLDLKLQFMECREEDYNKSLERHKRTIAYIEFVAVHLHKGPQSWDSILFVGYHRKIEL